MCIRMMSKYLTKCLHTLDFWGWVIFIKIDDAVMWYVKKHIHFID